MKKIPTLFQRDPNDRRHLLPEVTPGCEWVLAGEGIPTRKYDGTCVMLDHEGNWWARRELKAGKEMPPYYVVAGWDEVTGETVGWVPAGYSGFYQWLQEAVAADPEHKPGTYELCGPKINGDPEQLGSHHLLSHDHAMPLPSTPRDYEGLRAYLLAANYEGIVWHHDDGRMAKLKRRDFT